VTEPTVPPIVDPSVLDALLDSVGGDRAFVDDLVRTYLSDAATQLGDIEAAIGSGDAAALVRPAHTLKSASFTVGAMRLGERSRALEQAGRGGDVVGTADDLHEALESWTATDAALREWLDAHGAGG
jgi:HPt (histidine-containing phosphotransfer) domain-containing protein